MLPFPFGFLTSISELDRWSASRLRLVVVLILDLKLLRAKTAVESPTLAEVRKDVDVNGNKCLKMEAYRLSDGNNTHGTIVTFILNQL
jgi:hypothetical protein